MPLICYIHTNGSYFSTLILPLSFFVGKIFLSKQPVFFYCVCVLLVHGPCVDVISDLCARTSGAFRRGQTWPSALILCGESQVPHRLSQPTCLSPTRGRSFLSFFLTHTRSFVLFVKIFLSGWGVRPTMIGLSRVCVSPSASPHMPLVAVRRSVSNRVFLSFYQYLHTLPLFVFLFFFVFLFLSVFSSLCCCLPLQLSLPSSLSAKLSLS